MLALSCAARSTGFPASRAAWALQQLPYGVLGVSAGAATLTRCIGQATSKCVGATQYTDASLAGLGIRSFASGTNSRLQGPQWAFMLQQGYKINPCNSPLHPAVLQGSIEPEPGSEVCVQEAYTPASQCYGCGPAAKEGLQLKSRRAKGGLVANLRLDSKYCAFPGIINGGIISTVMDCHGNWTAAIALMDRACLPKPPLTLTASIFVTYKEPTPPNQDLVLRSKIISVKEMTLPGSKAQVEVDISLLLVEPGGGERLLVHGTGMFKRQGALRAL